MAVALSDHGPARERDGPRSQAGIGGRQLGPGDPG